MIASSSFAVTVFLLLMRLNSVYTFEISSALRTSQMFTQSSSVSAAKKLLQQKSLTLSSLQLLFRYPQHTSLKAMLSTAVTLFLQLLILQLKRTAKLSVAFVAVTAQLMLLSMLLSRLSVITMSLTISRFSQLLRVRKLLVQQLLSFVQTASSTQVRVCQLTSSVQVSERTSTLSTRLFMRRRKKC